MFSHYTYDSERNLWSTQEATSGHCHDLADISYDKGGFDSPHCADYGQRKSLESYLAQAEQILTAPELAGENFANLRPAPELTKNYEKLRWYSLPQDKLY